MRAGREGGVVAGTFAPMTVEGLARRFAEIGLSEGQVVLLHSSLTSLGWTVGGPVAVIEALLQVLGSSGTLVMPSHSADNSEPSRWQNPAVPAEWWPVIRASMPAFDPYKSPTRGMGKIAEAFRSWPGAIRSYHPTSSFSACGPMANRITADHDLADSFGEESPLARLYELDALVLLLGVGHGNNTSLHLAEARASYPGKRYQEDGSAVLVDGERSWVEYRHLDWDSDDFNELGRAFDADCGVEIHHLGLSEVRLVRQRPLVDFAVRWLEANRGS